MSIRLRMFDVGLGSAILTEFEQGGHVLRVLADGGDAQSGLAVEAFLTGLPSSGFKGRPLIDLAVGTHYDADHLDGLTAIFRANHVDISEIWLPPVLDDTDVVEDGRSPQARRSLAHLFAGPEGNSAFKRYVDAKRATLAIIDQAEGQAEVSSAHPNNADRLPEEERQFFESAAKLAGATLGERGREHDLSADLYETAPLLPWSAASITDGTSWLLRHGINGWPVLDKEAARASLAQMRMAVAKDGINACSLRSLLLAIPEGATRVRHLWCDDDRPLEFGWDREARRFREGYSGTPTLTILGPTERLVVERRDRIPHGVAFFAAKRWDRLEGLSHSNQLSYVFRLDFEGQGLLLCGDSGFDGFAVGKDRANVYEQALLNRLGGLAILQIPHHGGINRHFYRVMEASGFLDEKQMTYLLLSHEADSTYRPNGAFTSYMRRAASRPLSVLCTGRPADENMEGFRPRIHPAAPWGAAEGGDVVLAFGSRWNVELHGNNG